MLTILAALALGGAPTVSSQQSDLHARSDEARVVALINDGKARSATFRAVVAALNASDVVAYVHTTRSARAASNGTDFAGYLVHQVTKVGSIRYVHIVVNPTLSPDKLISVIAHELQHAVEIAQEPTVESDDAVRALFRRHDSGLCTRFLTCMETDAAMRVGDSVFRELRR